MPSTPNPAKGTALESEKNVREVRVMCTWPDPRDASGRMWAGTGMPSLRGSKSVPARKVTMPEDMAVNTCKDNASSCEQLIVPSRYEGTARSADLRIVRPTPDGGRAETTVTFALP
jgi:hypothetical protein